MRELVKKKGGFYYLGREAGDIQCMKKGLEGDEGLLGKKEDSPLQIQGGKGVGGK